MNLLLRHSIGFDLWLLVILFNIVTIVSSKTFILDYSTRCSFIFMPVITRSKAKLSTGSSKELLRDSSKNLSKEELNLSLSTSTTFPLLAPLSDSNNIGLPTTTTSPIPLKCPSLSSLSLRDSPAPSGDPTFQISSSEFRNLELSNSEFRNLELSNADSILFPSLPPNTSSLFFTMEADCMDDALDGKMSPDMFNLAQMIANLSSQVTHQTQSLENKISRDFSRVIEDNETFKSDVRAELDGICQLLDSYQITSDPQRMPSRSNSPPDVHHISTRTNIQHHTPSSTSSPAVALSVSPVPGNDPQTNLMSLLTETFTKLTATLSDKKEEFKYEWPKFSGDQKKFRAWYMAIVTQLSLPPWQDLYDSTTNDVSLSTTNTSLNAKLYAKLLVCLEGSAFQSIVSREHLRANGLLLLQDLVQTYRPKHVPEVISAKTSLFGVVPSVNHTRPLMSIIIGSVNYFMKSVVVPIRFPCKVQ